MADSSDDATPAGEPRVRRPWLHLTLFGLTFVSATWAYLVPARGESYLGAVLAAARDPEQLHGALVFAACLMAILLAHEMGHWLTARASGVDQSLPYFIPAPTLVGTLGAIIVMRSRPPNRSVLLRVAVMGPYAGLALALPAAAWGLAHSHAAFAPARPFVFGDSLLFDWLRGMFAPASEAGTLELHPVAFAGWVGLFVTSLNLIPASQLDGGHVAYALFGTRQTRLSMAVVIGLFTLGAVYAFPLRGAAPNLGGAVWIVWSLLLFVVGVQHPPVADDALALSPLERASGWVALALFVITFIPVPVTLLPRDGAGWRPPAFELPLGGEEEAPPAPPAEEFEL
jgi:membrane-associated protease RseP (regulator of RpoE activity)